MVQYLKTEKKIIEYDIVYCMRKSLGIRLDGNGNIFVRAPKGLSRQQVDRMLGEKINWILLHQDALQKLTKEREEKRYISGTTMYYKGHKYTLRIHRVDNKREQKVIVQDSIENEIEVFLVNPDQEYVKGLLESWYKEEARKSLNEKTSYFGKFFSRAYGTIRIKSMKTRWGSCSAKGNLNFNWKIIMAPENIIDYLVVHELAHLMEMNHSVNFYNQMSRVLPDYKNRQRWLKENGKYLEL